MEIMWLHLSVCLAERWPHEVGIILAPSYNKYTLERQPTMHHHVETPRRMPQQAVARDANLLLESQLALVAQTKTHQLLVVNAIDNSLFSCVIFL